MQHLAETTVLHLLRGALAAPERARVDVHIDECSECRELVSALAASRDTLGGTFESVPSQSPPGPAWQKGTVLGSRFEIEERCGQGGMGTLFRGRDMRTGAGVAIKALFLLSDQADFKRFEREADILASLDHPAIVRYVAHGTTSHGDAYLVMEWLAGEDLAGRLARGPIPVPEVLRLTKRIAQGLWLAHARGIVHRDVKPSNVMLPGGSVEVAKLVDFGIARATTPAQSATTRTQKGMLLGTPSYMAPEQARGRALDARADVFALGCVLYECLTGQRAFRGEDVLEVLARVLLDAPVPPSHLTPSVPPALDALVLGMLEKDPANRVATCREIIAAIQPLLGEGATSVTPTPPPPEIRPSARPSAARSQPPRTPRPAPRIAVVAVIASVTAILGVIALSTVLWRSRAAPSNASAADDPGSSQARTRTDPSSSALNIASLATLSLARTPESMAAVTGHSATKDTVGELTMTVPLAGDSFTRLKLTWDPSDPTHVAEVELSSDAAPPHDAAIRQKLTRLLGRRFDKDGHMSWNGATFVYDGTRARGDADRTIQGAPNPSWKAQVDATWNLLRGVVLELPVDVTEAEQRDWLGRGYSLAAIAGIDAAADTDHAEAMTRRTLPGVAVRTVVGVEHTFAVDHPWYGAATLTWKNEKGGALQELSLRPPPDTDGNFHDPVAIEACVQALVEVAPREGAGRRTDPNHDTWWWPAQGGTVRAYRHMLVVSLVSPFVPKKMAPHDFARLVRALDTCGRKT